MIFFFQNFFSCAPSEGQKQIMCWGGGWRSHTEEAELWSQGRQFCVSLVIAPEASPRAHALQACPHTG